MSNVSSLKRNDLLDVSRGVAIILVVIGHTFQSLLQEYNSFYGFRLIYSFHMPFFTLLSGASASFWISKIDFSNPLKENFVLLFSRIKKSTFHLVIPYISWCIIGYIIGHTQYNFVKYVIKVINNPDYGLWFLLMVFWCICFTCIYTFLISLVYKKVNINKKTNNKYIIIIGSFLIWLVLRRFLPSSFGIYFMNNFHNGLYLYFLSGALFFNHISKIKSIKKRIIPYLIFIPLSTIWDTTGPYKISDNASFLLDHHWIAQSYSLIVAFMGSLVFIDISKIVLSFKIQIITKICTTLGKKSLAIYAIHFYFLTYKPYVIAPIILSLLIYYIISNIKPLKVLIFG